MSNRSTEAHFLFRAIYTYLQHISCLHTHIPYIESTGIVSHRPKGFDSQLHHSFLPLLPIQGLGTIMAWSSLRAKWRGREQIELIVTKDASSQGQTSSSPHLLHCRVPHNRSSKIQYLLSQCSHIAYHPWTRLFGVPTNGLPAVIFYHFPTWRESFVCARVRCYVCAL